MLTLALAACRSTPPETTGEDARGRDWHLAVEGNRELTLGEVLEAAKPEVEALIRGGFRKPDLDDLAYEVERAYRERGYAFATVAYEHDTASARAVLAIDEGPRVEVAGVEIDGNEAVSDADLRVLLPERRHGLLGLGGRLFVPSDVHAFPGAIEDAYVERGFPDSAAEDATVEFSEDRRMATIRVAVVEGAHHVVGGLVSADLPFIERDAVSSAMAEFVDAPWVPRRGVEIRGALLELYAERGYPDAKVETSETMSEGPEGVVAWYTPRARPGPKVLVRSVRVEGCEDVNPDFVRSRIVFRDGDVYDSRRARLSFRRLFGTGLFRSADVKLEGTGEERDLVVRVAEGSSLEYFFELGFGSYDLLRAKTGVRDRNLFDSGLIGRAELVASIRGAQVTLGVTDPWFLRSDWTLDVPVKVLRREEPSFTIEEAGIEPRLSRAFTESFTAGWAYRFDLSRLETLEADDPQSELDEEENLRVGATGPFANLDDRDNLFAPAAGGITRAAVELGAPSLGGEISFAHASLSTARFVEIFDGTVLAARAETEWIEPLWGTDSIPIQERLFNGGENSVRSFKEDELGPKDDDGDPLGGEVRNLLSIELRQRIEGELSFALFWDAGNVAAKTSQPFVGFRHAVGTGLRYMLPIGPLRLDVGFNPSPADGEDEYVIQVAVGMPY